MKSIILSAVGLLFFCSGANAQTAEDIANVENYLNNLKTLSAQFVQTASNGSSADGRIFIAKPNKIKMDYDEPTSVLIVGNGDYIVYNDKELGQVTNIDYEDIPASLLLTDKVEIDGKNLKVTDFYKDSGTTEMTLEYAKGSTGPITLVFSNQPFELKQWKIVDPQSIEVSISLYNIQKDEPISDDTFRFSRKEKKNRRKK